ncbi:MAG: nicotinamide mononucleotide transporter [Erysipelotrichales bacterium]|nr:nicotinamide mononucleotide transporter [Erysipelotrichales bacterium]
MKILSIFKDLTKFERILWGSSVIIIIISYLLSHSTNYLTLIASLIGVTALIFVAKGYVIGQILTVVFAVFYGVISLYFRYYGEMITYLGMTSPIAIVTVIEWMKHPYKDTKEVMVSNLSTEQIMIMLLLTIITTVLFYFILVKLNTANLLFSTISIATSFLASYLTLMRSPYYALAYALNDIVLIVLWVLASLTDSSYIPMIICFIIFLINDIYGFINWQRMSNRQRSK